MFDKKNNKKILNKKGTQGSACGLQLVKTYFWLLLLSETEINKYLQVAE